MEQHNWNGLDLGRNTDGKHEIFTYLDVRWWKPRLGWQLQKQKIQHYMICWWTKYKNESEKRWNKKEQYILLAQSRTKIILVKVNGDSKVLSLTDKH